MLKGNKENKKRSTVVLDSLEAGTDLICFADYQLKNRRVGAYLLERGGRYQLVFGFNFAGFHPDLREEQIEPIFERLEGGLKDFPVGERLRVHFENFRGDGGRDEELERLIRGANSELLRYLFASQRARERELRRGGGLREHRLTLYATVTLGREESEIGDSWLERLAAVSYAQLERLSGGQDSLGQQKLEQILRRGFEGYLRWDYFLRVTLGWEVETLGYEALWGALWRRLNVQDVAVPPPQVLRISDSGMDEMIRSDLHPVSVAVAEQEPVADQAWVWARGKYIGVHTLVDKPAGWADQREQLRYLWSTLLSKEPLWDIEVITEISRANESLVNEAVRRLLAQSLNAGAVAQGAGTIDVGAQIRAERAVDAQAEIYRGAVPFWVGLVVLVHRSNIETLDETCRYVESCFLRPAWMEREKFIAWKIWLQTLPITFEGLLTKPFNRRHLFLHSEVPGLLPLIKVHRDDRQGLMLVSSEGFAPIFLDIFSQAQHTAIFAATRRGKSVLSTYFVLTALAQGNGATLLDYPRADGTSTFTDLTRLCDGAYVDVARESLNCMEIPDFSYIEDSKRAGFFEDYKQFVKNLYFLIVMGTQKENHASRIGTQVRALIDIAVDEFFGDPQIKQRYEMGAIDPRAIPTGRDFFPYTQRDRFNLSDIVGDTNEAFNLIELRLRQFLGSAVGRAITSQSTMRTQNPLTVFAFTNVSNDEDAAILSVVALSAALRNSLRYQRSLFFVDEAPILFEFDQIADLIARLCANGAKAGISVIISAQDPDTIVKASSSSKIIQNLSAILVGAINESAVRSFVDKLHFPYETISRNASRSFHPNKIERYSQWLLNYKGFQTYCRFYPGILQLALVANNPDEQKMRDEVLKRHHGIEGYEELCRRFIGGK